MKKKTILLQILLIIQILVVVAQVPNISPDIKPTPNTLQFYVFGDWGRKGQALSNSEEEKNQD